MTTMKQGVISSYAGIESKTPGKRQKNRKKKSTSNLNAVRNKNTEALLQPEQHRSMADGMMHLQSSSWNHHGQIRANVVAKGFSGEEVDTALEEMWNKQLAYDEYDAVLQYLEKSRARGGQGQNDGPKRKVEDTMASTSPARWGGGPEDKGQEAVPDGDDAEDTGNKWNIAQNVQTTVENPLELTTMGSKLDAVAGFENLTDAAFALTEWVIKAAKPCEVSSKD
jgi:hypothetical protein